MDKYGDKMIIAIDLDNTITASRESIRFFSVLTNLLIPEHNIVIITNREPNSEQDIAEELDCFGIEYSQIVITDRKADFIRQNNVSVYFENEDEYFLMLPETVTVFKIREDGNFSFAEKKWYGSKMTTKMINEDKLNK